MVSLTDRFNPQVDFIEVSDIRKFDERVSNIDGMIKLTLGEPDFNTPEHVKDSAIDAINDNYTHYTGMSGLLELREAASEFFKDKYNLSYDPNDEILVTIGATEAISASLLSILEPGDKVLIPAPAYPGYEPILTLAGAEKVVLDTRKNNFVLTPQMIDDAMAEHGDKVKAIILTYPNNPTGVTYSREELKAIAETLKKYPIFVICDEIYSELTYDNEHVSIAEYIRDQAIVINGLSKSHAMTGWRIGVIMADRSFIQQIIKVHQYLVTASSTISQKAAVDAFTVGKDDALAMREEYKVRRDFVYNRMKELGFETAQPSGAFYLFAKIPDGYNQDSMEFCVDLAQKNKVAIIPGMAFGEEAEGYVRLSYAASMEDLEEAMNRIEYYINENK